MGSPSFKQPQKAEVVEPAKTETKEVQDAASEALRRRKTAAGYRSTILSSLAGSGAGGGGQTTMGG
jgi:hypothetical protein